LLVKLYPATESISILLDWPSMTGNVKTIVPKTAGTVLKSPVVAERQNTVTSSGTSPVMVPVIRYATCSECTEISSKGPIEDSSNALQPPNVETWSGMLSPSERRSGFSKRYLSEEEFEGIPLQ